METIKAKELMTGDWITGNNGEPTQVQNVLVEAVMTTDGQGLDERNGEIHPIPLNIEIIKKNGLMEYLYYLDCPYRELATFRFMLPGLTNEIEVIVNYVHELQHALRFCGIEKEVVL